MATAVENWDDDLDFQGELHGFNNSTGTAQTSISSRLSLHSESLAGDEDWNVVLPANEEQAATKAVQSARNAGITLPINVPTSALLGGTIRRLGKKTSKQKVDDDWDNDIDMGEAPLALKPRTEFVDNNIASEEYDDFDELEGSLGIRFAGISRDARDSSTSAFSPSMGSATAESDLDDIGGLELPEGPMDFDAILKKRRATEAELSDLSQASPAVEQTELINTHKKSKTLAEDGDDFFKDLDFGADTLDVQKRTMNKNIRLKNAKAAVPASRPATTLNFHDKPTDKPMHSRSHLPRPVSGSKPPNTRLEPVFESGASQVHRERRPLTTTSAQLLRAKRSLPVLSQNRAHIQRNPPPFVTGFSNFTPPGSAQRSMPYHLRRDSESSRQGAQSPPPLRSHSRLSNNYVPDTPSRKKTADQAPSSLVKEAASKRNVTRPTRRRNYGDGLELEIFDDLPTSQQKEAKFTKQPTARGGPKLGLRQTQSRIDARDAAKRAAAPPDRMTTPAPPRTPVSPTKGFYDAPQETPSYLRNTAASRARESMAQTKSISTNPRPRSEGPLMPLSTNWKAQVAARSPQNSPSAQRNKLRKIQPQLIRGNGAHVAKTEKGMIYNPNALRWEGNENTLSRFEIPPALETPTPQSQQEAASYMEKAFGPSASPPRPALIAPMSAATNLQVNGHMVFDPHQMKWLKLKSGRDVSGPLSPSVTDEEEDVFAGLDDLKEAPPAIGVANAVRLASPLSMANAGIGEVHEEFDLGPQFIRLQREEEANWRRRCDAWFHNDESRLDDGRWRWSIRDIATPEPV